MIAEFVREQKRYTQRELCSLLHCSEIEGVPLIKKMKEYGILKTVKNTDSQRDMTDLLDEDIEIADVEVGETKYLYVFKYVGIIVIAGRVLLCYPKYLLKAHNPKNELQQVLKVLEKYNADKQIINMFDDYIDGSSFNLLAMLIYFLQDYYENGIYNNTEDIIESNGSGEIVWDKTINEFYAVIVGNKPYYFDLKTKKRVTNNFDYFKRLHEYILTKASNELKSADLLELFGITEVELSDENLDDFGGDEQILYRIEKELNIQYNTRKQLLLKAIYAYIAQNGSLYDTDTLSLFGTTKFYKVWEDICSDILDNQLDYKVGEIQLPISLKDSYNKNFKLIELIEKPYWSETKKKADHTLIPDLISISGKKFFIFDAKYYNARLEPNIAPQGQPGIESITKQYLYQLAYKNFIKDHGFSVVRNCFLLPTEGEEIVDKGEVLLEMLSSLGLQNIQVKLLPAKMVYDYYLSGQKMDTNLLRL